MFKKNNFFELTTIEEELVIGPKTIIINESKISMPKDMEEPDNILNKGYYIYELDNTLLFTINKLIRKIEFYYTFLKNEFLKEKDDINDYKFLLCLFINNIPSSDINNIIKKDLNLLIKNGYIKNEFKLKCLYLKTIIGSYNLRTIQEDLNNKMEEIKEAVQIQIQQIINKYEKEKKQNNLERDYLLFKYNEARQQNIKNQFTQK